MVVGTGMSMGMDVSVPTTNVTLEMKEHSEQWTVRYGAMSTNGKVVFGVPLALGIQRSPAYLPDSLWPTRGYSRVPMPAPLVDAVVFLSQREALTTEGLYRIPGNKKHVNLYRSIYNSSNRISFTASDDPNDVASLLLLFLKSLPEPIYGSMLLEHARAQGTSSPEQVITVFRTVLEGLTRERQACLRLVLDHLHVVASYSFENKMTPRNLATCVFSDVAAILAVAIEHADQL